jgi:predicted nucleic acid-binding protein
VTILADTSVWIDHLRRGRSELAAQLEWGQIVQHPAVIGELACGTFRDRDVILDAIRRLPQIMEAQHDEVMALIEEHRLMGSGIGWIDAHLLASAVLSDVQLWTLDRRLADAARRISTTRKA